MASQRGKHPTLAVGARRAMRGLAVTRTSLCSAENIAPVQRFVCTFLLSFLPDLVEFKSLRRIATCLMRPRGIASAIPACPARSASVRCIDVRTEAECNAFARGSRRLVAGERGYPPPGRTPSSGHLRIQNEPGVVPSGSKTYGETRENLHDERNGRALPVHADERLGHTPIAPLVARWVAAVSVLLAFASPAFAPASQGLCRRDFRRSGGLRRGSRHKFWHLRSAARTRWVRNTLWRRTSRTRVVCVDRSGWHGGQKGARAAGEDRGRLRADRAGLCVRARTHHSVLLRRSRDLDEIPEAHPLR